MTRTNIIIVRKNTGSLETRHIAPNDPAHVLRTVAAHREIVDAYESSVRRLGPGLSRELERLVLAVAAIYAESHPGFDEIEERS